MSEAQAGVLTQLTSFSSYMGKLTSLKSVGGAGKWVTTPAMKPFKGENLPAQARSPAHNSVHQQEPSAPEHLKRCLRGQHAGELRANPFRGDVFPTLPK